MIEDIVFSSKRDIRGQIYTFGLSNKVRRIKCIQKLSDSKPTAILASGESRTPMSTIMKRVLHVERKGYFFVTNSNSALLLKLGIGTELSMFRIIDIPKFWRRIRMAEVVSLLSVYELHRRASNRTPVTTTLKFEIDVPNGVYDSIESRSITQERIREAYQEFITIDVLDVEKIDRYYTSRLFRDRALCAYALSQCLHSL